MNETELKAIWKILEELRSKTSTLLIEVDKLHDKIDEIKDNKLVLSVIQ